MREALRIDHLLRRTGFGATPEARKRAHRMGYEQTVRRIIQQANQYRLAEPPPATPLPSLVIPATLISFGQGVLWWLETLTKTKSPFNERLTMFWHRHFATSGAKVFNPGWMFDQNQTFRLFGNGAFADLLKKMVKDPALLTYLDARNNPASKPNENFARELMELFTLGIGNYTEQDVKELAKLTTGKRVTLGGKTPDNPHGCYDGPVQVLGRKGQLKLLDMTEYLAVHPATTKRTVAHLWADLSASPIPEAEAHRLGKLWRKSRGNVTLVAREILLSKHFHDAPRERVLSPVEYWVTCSRLLGVCNYKLDDVGFLEQAGEQLFFPPSVKGWDHGQALIHPAALQTRMEIANRVVSRLSKRHWALTGFAESPVPARYLSHITGGQVKVSTLPPDIGSFKPREALLLTLSSPDMWTM